MVFGQVYFCFSPQKPSCFTGWFLAEIHCHLGFWFEYLLSGCGWLLARNQSKYVLPLLGQSTKASKLDRFKGKFSFGSVLVIYCCASYIYSHKIPDAQIDKTRTFTAQQTVANSQINKSSIVNFATNFAGVVYLSIVSYVPNKINFSDPVPWVFMAVCNEHLYKVLEVYAARGSSTSTCAGGPTKLFVRMKMAVTDKWAGYLSRLDKRVHICMLLTKRMFLVMDKNVGLCLFIYLLLINYWPFLFWPLKMSL